jgi:hypothetical protein
MNDRHVRNTSRLLVFCTYIVFFGFSGYADSPKEKNRKMDIYLLIGQSNMAGRAPIEDVDKDTLENVFLFAGNDSVIWEKAANPLNKFSSIRKEMSMQRLGPGYTFAKEMARESKRPIGLVVNAKGGTAIELWVPGTQFYNEAVERTKQALKYGKLKGILWHQGESNVSNYDAYMPRLLALITALRSDFNQPHLPFVACQLSDDREARIKFNKMIVTLLKETDHAGVVTAENTSTMEKTHFDSASQRELGRRYAEIMQKLLRDK